MIQSLHEYLPVNSLNELNVYKEILDNTAIIVMVDQDQQVVYVNQKFCDKSGFTKEEILGKHFDWLRSEDFSPDIVRKMWENLNGGMVWQGELMNKKSNGDYYWEEAVIYPFRKNGKKPYQYISIGSDITSFKHAMQIKDQFLANMSHELRTPLHSIYSLSNLLEETPLNEDQNTYVENILNATQILMRMVEDMLDIDKIENGQIRFEKKIFNPHLIINALAKMFAEKTRVKKLEFKLSYDKALPEFVLGDPFRLKQVLMHLLDNAIKYTSKGQIDLVCRLAGNDDDNYFFEFTVIDTGMGIANNDLDKIQEKFQQAKMDDKRVFKGQGLGLTIVRQLIELQHGEFTLTSQEGKGTQAQFLIPYQFPKGENIELAKDSTPEQSKSEENLRVLIAEDVDINQLVIKKHMQKFGFDADFAENGKIALEKLRNSQYDIVLMDMQMPVMDGYEAIRLIRKDFPEPVRSIPIISITASVMGEAPKRCLEAGANDYVPKPYDIKDLRKKIELYVGKPQEGNQLNDHDMHDTSNHKTSKRLIDLDYLHQLSEGDDDFTISMLSYFLDNTPVVLSELKQYYDDQDWKSLRNIAHKFKPQLTFMGIKSIFTEVESIEQNAAHVKNTEEIPDLILKVDAVCTEAMKEIGMELEKMLDKDQ